MWIPDRMPRRRTVVGVVIALLAGAAFAVSITLLATRVASPEIGLENSPVIIESPASVTVTSTVDTSAPGLSPDDDHDSDDD